jgi:hypothetical protein
MPSTANTQSQVTTLPDRIKKLRQIARECADLQEVQKYVADTAKNVRQLLQKLNVSAWEDRLHKEDVGSAGQVLVGHVNDVVESGNLREQMTMLMNFTDKNHDVFASLMAYRLTSTILPDNINIFTIDALIQKLKQTTALSPDALVKRLSMCGVGCLDDSSCTPSCVVTKAALVPDMSALVLSRIAGFPVGPPTAVRDVRSKPEADKWPFRVRASEAYPHISEREKNFMQKKGYNVSSDNDLLPWVTGWGYWSIKQNSIYGYIVNGISALDNTNSSNKQLIIAGPSGATDMLFDVFRLFNDFKPELAMLACVAYMGNPPDHSCVEILLACTQYLPNYTSDINADMYVQDCIAKIKKQRVINHRQPEGLQGGSAKSKGRRKPNQSSTKKPAKK